MKPFSKYIVLLLSAFLVICSCETVEIIIFDHKDSDTFFKNRQLDLDKYKKHVTNDSLLTIDVKQATHDDLLIWLGLFSNSMPEKLNVIHASIQNLDRTRIFKYEFQVIEAGVKDCSNTDGTNECAIKLFEYLSLNELEEFTQKSGFRIKVTLQINNEKIDQEFHIERRVEKYAVALSQ